MKLELSDMDRFVLKMEKDYPTCTVSTGEGLVVKFIPTGSVCLNDIMGGGVPAGHISLFYGQHACGKTATALTVLGNVTQGAIIDLEGSFSSQWAKNWIDSLGNIVVIKPLAGDDVENMIVDMAEAGIELIVVDSIPGLLPQSELDGKHEMAAQARLVNRMIRKITSVINQTGTTIIFINQIRMKVGVVFGSPETLPGGRALPYVAATIVKFRKANWIEVDGERAGIETRVTVEKNKFYPPQKETNFNIMWEGYIDTVEEHARMLILKGETTQQGAWFYYDGEKFHGKEDYVAYVREKFGDSL